ncbi:MAG: CBS domain-containing protein [Acidobacteriota bacterium]|nr:CBS domain-containing protein [Acidobacteriota bacterium]
MQVRDFMTPAPAACEPATTLRLAAKLMSDHNCAAIPIVDSNVAVGIVTDRDIACRAVALGWNAAELPASAIMSSPAIAVGPDEEWDKAIELMKENRIHHLLVIDDAGALVGIVAQSDLGRRMNNRELGDLARSTSLPPSATLRAVPLPATRRQNMGH